MAFCETPPGVGCEGAPTQLPEASHWSLVVQGLPSSHAVLGGSAVATQVGTPVVHTYAPCWQGCRPPGGVQLPAGQGSQVPAGLHTLPPPQGVPGVTGVGLAHCCAPLLQLVVPCMHGLPAMVHERPAWHAVQSPPGAHTALGPQGVPAATAAPGVHVPLLARQVVVPIGRQGIPVAHGALGTHPEAHAPAMHVCPPGQGFLHAPQLLRSLWRSASQPVSAEPSQSW